MGTSNTFPRIAVEANNLKRGIWDNRKQLLGSENVDPIDLIGPEVLAKYLGYQMKFHEELLTADQTAGQHIAGILARKNKTIYIAQQFSAQCRRWTGAHEIGHILLHDQLIAHRDRPMDGSSRGHRDIFERQADYFAAVWLMPAKLMYEEFKLRFGHPLQLDSDSHYWLVENNPKALKEPATPFDWAMLIATCENFGGRSLPSLASRFKVSPTAMAIRIQELEFFDNRLSSSK